MLKATNTTLWEMLKTASVPTPMALIMKQVQEVHVRELHFSILDRGSDSTLISYSGADPHLGTAFGLFLCKKAASTS